MMIVEIHKSRSGEIRSLMAADHAGFADEGEDIVCAAASTLVYTAIASLERLCGLTDCYRIVEDHDGDTVPFSEIILRDENLTEEQHSTSQIIMKTIETGFIQLQESIDEDYDQSFIQIREIIDDK
jgi:uncharacterized protein